LRWRQLDPLAIIFLEFLCKIKSRTNAIAFVEIFGDYFIACHCSTAIVATLHSSMNNFLDPYDLTSGTPPQQPEQSLNEEVSQVIGQLGRFWGDFRKTASVLISRLLPIR
jgi:hypothetical protein